MKSNQIYHDHLAKDFTGLDITFSSFAQEPKSISLHLAEQNGLCSLLLSVDVGLLHLGHLFIYIYTK